MNTPEIEVTCTPALVGRGRDAAVQLNHATVSRRHAILQRVGDSIQIKDLDSTYGTFVNDVRVQLSFLHIGDLVRFGTHATYRTTHTGLQPENTPEGIGLELRGISLARDGVTLLQRVSCRIEPNSFVGILGPSGAGKSTLLNCVAGYISPLAGDLLSDGSEVALSREQYQQVIGYVPQEDVVHLPLTCRENLLFAIRLRRGDRAGTKTVSSELTRVERLVGLEDHATKQTRILSGGQRKRVSVGIELINRPRLLLLDEPTSGLDPATEASLMEQLRHVCHQGTTVVCTTHLMENVRLFDSVIVLGVIGGVGQVAYIGPPGDMLRTFACHNYADLYDKLTRGEFVPVEIHHEHASYATTVTSVSSTPPFQRHTPDAASNPPVSSVTPQVESSLRSQVSLLCQRYATLLARNREHLWWLIVQPVALGSLACLTQYATADNHLALLLFFLVVISIWLGINNAATSIVRERKHYIREQLIGLSPKAYLLSQAIVHGIVGIAQVFLLSAVLRVFGGIILPEAAASALTDKSACWQFAVLLTCYLGGTAVGLLVSTLVKSEIAAIAIVPLIVMPQLLVSAVATGRTQEAVNAARDTGPFRPLAVTLSSLASGELGTGGPVQRITGLTMDAASLLCFSRPALLLLSSPEVPEGMRSGVGRLFWVFDVVHLAACIGVAWLAVFAVFESRQRSWSQLVGIG